MCEDQYFSCSDIGSTLQPAKAKGEDIRAVGSDIKEGQLVLEKGDRIGAAEIGILATVGASTLEVRSPLHAFLLLAVELH